MRFSIKWLLAATAYVAVVCTSVFYASNTWVEVLAFLSFAALVISTVAAFIARGAVRAFAIGFVAASVIVRIEKIEGYSPADKWSQRCVEVLANSRPSETDQLRRQVVRIWSLEPDAGPISFVVRLANGDRMVHLVDHENPYKVPASYFDSSLAAEPDWASARVVIGQHLNFLFAILSALLGLWFWRREEIKGSPS